MGRLPKTVQKTSLDIIMVASTAKKLLPIVLCIEKQNKNAA